MSQPRTSAPGHAARGVACLAVALLALAACDDSTEPNDGAVAVSVAAPSVTVVQGQNATTTITIARTGGFSGAVTLALEGAPSGLTADFAPASIASGATTSTLTLSAAPTLAPGTYATTVRASGQGVADETVELSVVVTPPPAFALALNPTALTLAQGANGTSTATITRSGGFTGPVTLTVTGAPTGVTTTVATSPVAGNTATITVAVGAAAAAGTHTLTVTGTGTGVTQQTASLALTVTAAQGGGFTLALAPTSLSVARGTSGTSTATITRAGTFAGPVTLAVTGAPTGVTTTIATSPVTGNTATITVAVAASAAAGTYPLTVTGTGAGVTQQTATLSLTVPATPSFALALNPTALTLAQGATGTSTATITRSGGFTAPVTLAVTGAPAGVTTTITTSPVTGTTATIGVAVGAATAPGAYTLTVTGTGTGVTQQTATLALTVSAAQGFTLALNPTSLSIPQGGSGTSTATIARSGGFTGPVALAVTGAPNGLTVTANPASVTGTTSTITASAAASLAAGTYTLTVTGTGTGVTQRTATLTVTVTSQSGQSVTLGFCASAAPIWLAVQSGTTGPWTQVAEGANHTFTFQLPVGGKGGVAWVTRTTTGATHLLVMYATTTELAASGGTTTVGCTTGGKTVNGSVAAVGATDLATIALGPSTATVIGALGVNTFQLTNVPDGALDLIASRAAQSGPQFAVNSIIIRRGLNPANGSTLPVLDFGSSEAFAPATANVTINGLGTDQASTGVGLVTANGSSGFFSFDAGGTSVTRPYAGVPDARLATGDLHQLFLSAAPAAGGSSRAVIQYFRSVTDRTVTLGSALGAPTITRVAATPYLRMRAQVTAPSEYNRLASVTYAQGSGGTARSATVMMTAGYAGGTTFDLVIPDLSGAGFTATWGLQPGVSTDWSVVAIGGTFGFGLPGQLPVAGSSILMASRDGTIVSP